MGLRRDTPDLPRGPGRYDAASHAPRPPTTAPVRAGCGRLAGPLAGVGGAQPAATPVRDRGGRVHRPAAARYLDERLEEAEDAGAVVVLQLDFPGTLGQDGVALADRVAAMEVGAHVGGAVRRARAAPASC